MESLYLMHSAYINQLIWLFKLQVIPQVLIDSQVFVNFMIKVDFNFAVWFQTFEMISISVEILLVFCEWNRNIRDMSNLSCGD